MSWNGVEVVRGIATVLRDENWGTLPAEDVRQDIDEASGSLHLTQRAGFLGGRLRARVQYSFCADGQAACSFALSVLADARLNRAGFTILHPLDGVAGCPVRVRHTDGADQDTQFPRLVAPAQPVFDIVELSHRIGSTRVCFEFTGEVFEMEDQRNWSDASFKTYCRPLSRPFPYEVRKGDSVRQSVRLRLSDADDVRLRSVSNSRSANLNHSRSPDILLAAQGGWNGSADSSASGFLLRMGHQHECSHDYLRSLAMLAKKSDAYIDAELIIDGSSGATEQFEQIASVLEAAGISPRHVIALPSAYLKSHQPTGPWPAGPTPEDCAALVRDHFPGAETGAGCLTNFTELNRYRPKAGIGDYVTHGNAAIVHAADDISVLETLEALPQIFASGRLIAGDRGYRLGLVAIAMRGNPYGTALAQNPEKTRKTMTGDDPRQKGLFGAAYAIGVTARAAGSGIQAVALAGAGGSFGVCDGQLLYPLFHVVKALTSIAGREVRPVFGNQDGLTGLRFDGGMVLANISPDPVELKRPPAKAAILDIAQFEAARQDASWLTNASKSIYGQITLGPFACLFAGLGGDQ